MEEEVAVTQREEENTNKEDSSSKEVAPETENIKSVEAPEEVNESKEEIPMEEEVAVTQNPKAKKSQAVKAAELVQDWDEEGDREPVEKTKPKTPASKQAAKPAATKDKMEPEFTPRKSSRAPKPTEKKLESENQKNLNNEDMEESVDAIAKELEKSDSEVKKAGTKNKSPKKGKKQQQTDGENKEDWVALIFGENGEKVTEKGTPRSKLAKPEENKTEEIGPEAEEFLDDQTPFFSAKNKGTKKGGRPRKKDLDEKMDGVAKLGSNMYFYTGPGGATNDSPINSDDDEETVKVKEKNENARKSGRANKGKNSRLERADEVVEMPQAKAREASLNPSWLKNHDGKKDTPAKKGPPTPTKAAATTPTVTPKQRGRAKEDKVEKMEVEKTEVEEKEEVP